MASNEADAGGQPCQACRGRGSKVVGTRSDTARSVADGRDRQTRKRRCLHCDGSGRKDI